MPINCKDIKTRLSEVMAMYTELDKFHLNKEDLEKFKQDCQIFAKDGVPITGKTYLKSLNRYLHYDLKTKNGYESVAIIKNNRE
ncbi:hypothetical protein TetV_238 [Tetraselmis virus 1]|uniref:Uncharacterized protein n=1 Tax=Tetraselmis virus 1 TaxID=2060617 RepID=A0A2P0VN77_9VIRU|nr:hypothetical protein QJ968_gp238 [Tetraselmis virus 1]AUF82330.1 hypothetical protein TetV_238 [Tetraselmis virus 1]